MSLETAREALRKAVVDKDGRRTVSCAEAFLIAEAAGVSRAALGRLCEEDGIRIRACQLGCFP